MANLKWTPIIKRAAEIVLSYDTLVTLRQLFYQLVATALLPNTKSYYQRLSCYTAQGRREGTFPDLLDRRSRIEVFQHFPSPEAALARLRDTYRRDRTEGQEWTIFLGVEKDGMSNQLDAWFTDPLGIPHVALGGYASQTLADSVRRYIRAGNRPAALVYAGDLDPSGEDLDRDFVKRVGIFDEVRRIALSDDQVQEFQIPLNELDLMMGKVERDPRSKAFIERHGDLYQYELDAIAPNVLRDMYRTAIAEFHDPDIFAAVLEREELERERLA